MKLDLPRATPASAAFAGCSLMVVFAVLEQVVLHDGLEDTAWRHLPTIVGFPYFYLSFAMWVGGREVSGRSSPRTLAELVGSGVPGRMLAWFIGAAATGTALDRYLPGG